MAGLKIHQYPLERTSFGDEDFYDIDYWDGSGYQTAKIKGSVLKQALGLAYLDIQDFTSGYTIQPSDAGKLITNGNTPFRDLILGLVSAPNFTFNVKGRVAIAPALGVNVTLPDGSVITNPSTFTPSNDSFYIVQKNGFSGSDWIISEINSKTLSNLALADQIQMGLVREYEVFEDGTLKFVTNDPNNSATFEIGENSNERFGEIELNSVTFNQTVATQTAGNDGQGVITRVNPNEFDIDSRDDISDVATRRNRIYFSPQETTIEHSDSGRLTFRETILGNENVFEDLSAVKKGLQYADDYSVDYVDRSLVDKAYVDASSKNLANTDLTQTAGEDREYNLNGRFLAFLNSMRFSASGNRSLSQFSQNFTTSVDDAQMENNSISPLLDTVTADLYWKYKNNLGVVSDLYAKVDKTKVYGGTRYTLIKSNGTQEYYSTLAQVRLNWVDGDVLHQFSDETAISFVNNGSSIMFDIPSITWVGNGFKTKVLSVATNSFAFNVGSAKTTYFLGVNLNSQGVNTATTLRVQGVGYLDYASNVSMQVENARNSSFAFFVTGTSYGGNVTPEGNAISATNPPNGIGGSGVIIGLNTNGFQLGTATNFYNGRTTYPCATNFRHSYCDFGSLQIGSGRVFDFCEIRSTCNNNGSNFATFTARNCNIIHAPSANTHTFYNIPNIILINCNFISGGYLCATFGGTSGSNRIIGGYMAFANQTQFAANNYAGLVEIRDCTIEATNANASTDVLLFTNAASTNVKINNVTFLNASGRSDIRVLPANNVEWKNCRFSKGSAHISVSSGTVADACINNPARLTDPKGWLNNTGNGNWFMYVPMTTAERDALTSVSKNFTIENTTTNFLQVYNGSTWKDLLDLT